MEPPKNLFFRLKAVGKDSLGSTVRYEGLDGDTVEIREPEDAKTAEPPKDAYTVDEAVEYLGFGKFQVMLSLLTGLAWVGQENFDYITEKFDLSDKAA